MFKDLKMGIRLTVEWDFYCLCLLLEHPSAHGPGVAVWTLGTWKVNGIYQRVCLIKLYRLFITFR